MNNNFYKVQGKYTDALIMTDYIEETAMSQVIDICNHPIFEGQKIVIQPDCHAGAGCVIGFTSTCDGERVIPNIVGVDLNCAVMSVNIGNIDVDLPELDNIIRNKIPHGQKRHKSSSKEREEIIRNILLEMYEVE